MPRDRQTNKVIYETNVQPGQTDSYEMTITFKDIENGNNESNIGASFNITLNIQEIDAGLDTLKRLSKLNPDIKLNNDCSQTGYIPKGDESVCKSVDDYGNTYYFRGVPTDNYVKFANYYWRIVRINGNGSIRLIYDGTSAHANGEHSTDRNIGTSAFNTSYDSPAYAGYMYNTVYNSKTKDVLPSTSVDMEVETSKLNQTDYANISNDTTYPFKWDDANKTWTSTVHDDSKSATITFNPNEAGNYYLTYTISSEQNYDKVTFYVNNTQKEQVSGSSTRTISLGKLKTSDVVKVTYSKDVSTSRGNDNVIFSLGNPTENTKNYVFGDSYEANGNNYTIKDNTITITNDNWYADYSKAKGKWTCLSSDTTCENPVFITKTTNNDYSYANLSTINNSMFKYGNDVVYENGTYTLTDTKQFWNWFENYNKISNNHYTCFNSTGTCTDVYYVYYATNYSTDAYYITLSGGKKVENALDEMLGTDGTDGTNVNVKDSNIKKYLDTWYTNNLTNYSQYLSDSDFCNARTIKSPGSFNPNGGDTTYYQALLFNDNVSNTFTCSQKNDRFTVSDKNIGNANLTYPIGMLTKDEVRFAGGASGVETDCYLYTGDWLRLETPYSFEQGRIRRWCINAKGFLDYNDTCNYYGVIRPVINLNPSVTLSGSGTQTDPFTVS